MLSPGRYVPDPTAGIAHPNDLPPPIIQKRSRIRKKCRCPHCEYLARQHDIRHRPLHHLGDSHSGRSIKLILTHSIHYCCKCKTYFNIDTTDIADPGSHYTKQVVDLALRFVAEDGSPYRDASWRLWRDHRVFVPFATIQNWVEAAGKKNVLED